jgi:hypothetical protein
MMGQKLHAVADAQYGHTQGQKTRIEGRRVLVHDAGGTAGEHQGLGPERLDGLEVRVAGVDFRIDPGLADAPRDELGDLGPEVQNNDDISVLHALSSIPRL